VTIKFSVTPETEASVEEPSIGMAFRMQDERNHYRFMVHADGSDQFQELHSVVDGTVTVLAKHAARMSAGTTYEFDIELEGSNIKVLNNGNEWVNEDNDDHRFGSTAFVSAGKGEFGYFSIQTACDSGDTCQFASSGTRCTWECADGYTNEGGAEARTCSAAGTYSGSELQCEINRPVVPPMTRAVDEQA